MVDSSPEGSDQLQPRSCGGQHFGIDSVGYCWNQNIGLADRVPQLGFVEGFVVKVETTSEKLHHPGLDRIRELARDNHK